MRRAAKVQPAYDCIVSACLEARLIRLSPASVYWQTRSTIVQVSPSSMHQRFRGILDE